MSSSAIDAAAAALQRGETVVVPDEDAARAWRHVIARRAPNRVVPTPPVYGWSAYVARLYAAQTLHSKDMPAVCSPLLEQALWRLVVTDELDALARLTIADEARHMMRIWRKLCVAGGVAAVLRATPTGSDAARLQRRCQRFADYCRQYGMITTAQRVDVLTDVGVTATDDVHFFGLRDDDRHVRLLADTVGAGTIDETMMTTDAPPPTVCCYDDDEAEAAAIAAWITAARTARSDAALAVVAPPQWRPGYVPSVLDDCMCQTPSLSATAVLLPLRHVLNWWWRGSVADHEARVVLTAPSLRIFADDHDARHRALTVWQRSRNDRFTDGIGEAVFDRWLRGLQAIARDNAPMGVWCDRIAAVIKHAGWPNARDLPYHVRVQQGVNAALDALSAVSLLEQTWSIEDAMSLWRQALDDVSSPTAGTVPRVSAQTAAAAPFDAVWIAAADLTSWTQPLDDPLPLPLVELTGLAPPDPHDVTDAERQHRYWQALQERHVVHAASTVGERAAVLPFAEATVVNAPPTERQLPVAQAWERVSVQPPPLEPPLSTAFLNDFSKCPFYAFARHQLRLPSSPPARGLDPLLRGTVFHRAAQLLYEPTIDAGFAPALLDAAAITAAVATACDEAKLASIDPVRASIERERLLVKLTAIRDLDATRTPFTTIACEHTLQLPAQTIVPQASGECRLRIDRVDRLADDGLCVIDYKSGAATQPPPLATDDTSRLTDWQMPLYLLAANHVWSAPVRALLFLQVGGDVPRYHGIYDSDSIDDPQTLFGEMGTRLKGVPFSERREHWRAALVVMLARYRDGEIKPQPIDGNICRRCLYRSLCRIDEL